VVSGEPQGSRTPWPLSVAARTHLSLLGMRTEDGASRDSLNARSRGPMTSSVASSRSTAAVRSNARVVERCRRLVGLA